MSELYESLVDHVVPVSGPKEAELTKLLENTFRHVNIALVNELAIFAHELGIDVWEVINAAGTKPFGFMKFTPGPGVEDIVFPSSSFVPVVAGTKESWTQLPVCGVG